MTALLSSAKVSSSVEEPRSRRLESITQPLAALASRSSSFLAAEPGRFEVRGQACELPRYLFIGPRGGSDPIRLGLFAGLHGDEPVGAHALVRLVQMLERRPKIAQGYCLFIYPVCNPTGFVDGTRHARSGKDPNREFWRGSREPEVRLLEGELWAHAFDGIIALHSDRDCEGLYGFASGALFSEYLLRPALTAATDLLPIDHRAVIDGLPAEAGIIRKGYEGVLGAPPKLRPKPFEIVLETPTQPSAYLQEAALLIALKTILTEYRQFIAYAPNL